MNSPQFNSPLWKGLESVLNQSAATGSWKRRLGDHFPVIASTLFRRLEETATGIWCEECYCSHEVITFPDGECVGVCQCDDDMGCDEMRLTPEDITCWELNWTKLGRAVMRAFDGEWRELDFGLHRTRQIGSYGGADLPVILTIAHDRAEFRSFVAEVCARFRSGFILLSPTAQFVTVATQEMITNARAAYFDLETHTVLSPEGTLHGRRTGAQLFSPYLIKQADPVEKGEANRVFSLMKTLDGGSKLRKAPLEQVFRRLILDGLSQAAVAQRYQCAPSLITMRVAEIEKRFGVPLDDLRLHATQLAEMEMASRPAKTPVRRSMEDSSREDH